MNEVVETIDYRGYTINIYDDEYPENPREWCNLGTMAFYHRRYNLGDTKEFSDHKALESYLYSEDFRGVFMPVYMYEHGGITISTSPFSSNWDSGKLGYIYIDRETILHEYGGKYLTKKKREKAKAVLQSEIETYDMYIRGDVYSFIVEDPHGEHIYSYAGFFGYNHEKSGLLDYAKSDINYDIQQRQKEKEEKIKENKNTD